MKKLICLLLFVLCTPIIANELPVNRPNLHPKIELERNIHQLSLLIQKRLVIMHEVAKTKWNLNLPIEDKVREQQILWDLSAKAKKYNLDESWVAKFFQAQMDAAKEIQKSDFALWKKEGIQKFEVVLSLKTDLRSAIDQINEEILLVLSKLKYQDISNALDQPISPRETDHIENDIWLLATSPFSAD